MQFETLFTRESLMENTFLVYRMNMYLDLPIEAIYIERSIRSITEDKNLILQVRFFTFFQQKFN